MNKLQTQLNRLNRSYSTISSRHGNRPNISRTWKVSVSASSPLRSHRPLFPAFYRPIVTVWKRGNCSSSSRDPSVIAAQVMNLRQLAEIGLSDELETEFASIFPGDRTVDHYNVLLDYHARRGDSDQVLALFDEMKTLQITPDHQSYNTTLEVMAWALREQDVQRLFDEMKANSIKPTELSLNAVVEMYQQIGKLEDAESYRMQLIEAFPDDEKTTEPSTPK